MREQAKTFSAEDNSGLLQAIICTMHGATARQRDREIPVPAERERWLQVGRTMETGKSATDASSHTRLPGKLMPAVAWCRRSSRHA